MGCHVVSIRGVVFDVDDTLYLERDYVRSGFSAVADVVHSSVGIPKAELFSFLWACFERDNRGNTFNLLCDAYPEIVERYPVVDLVEVYRSHRPRLSLPSESKQVLGRLRMAGLRIGLISDGPLSSQSAKVSALQLDSIADEIVLTDSWGRSYWKPHTRAFEEIARRFGMAHRELCYVADNPAKDFCTPKALGWYTIRVRCPGQERYFMEPHNEDHAPNTTVSSLPAALDEVMKRV